MTLPPERLEPLRELLESKLTVYQGPAFIASDPISIPHRFKQRQDIEISGFFAAVLAWGQRKTIIAKCDLLLGLFDNEPYEYIIGHRPSDLKRMLTFTHRTFQPTDLLHFIRFLRHHYQQNDSLQSAFPVQAHETDVTGALNRFRRYFLSLPDTPDRTRKHIASPDQGSACKRLNMFLRWMVRPHSSGIDFGVWKDVKPRQLVCPVDLHSGRVARRLGLLTRHQNDWKAALELTGNLRLLNPQDPVRYDIALFGMGAIGDELYLRRSWKAS
jgi:uncharacterized protein (TIGR02757 family)